MSAWKNGSAASIHPFLDHPDTHVRLAAVIALGNISDESSVLFLRKALHDSEPNVQWDAAIGLAKMNDASGRDILINLLDRNYLAKFPEVDLQEQTQIIIVAIQAAKFLNDGVLNSVIGQLAKNDTNMNVRAAALK